MNCYPVTDGTNLSRMSHTLKAPSKMFPVKEDFKDKIKTQGQNFNCETCKTKKDTQKHLLQCQVLKVMELPYITPSN